MKTSLQLKQSKAELLTKVQAITDVAKAENRELTAEESAEIDAILGQGQPGQAGYKAGQVDALDAEIARAEKIEARQLELAAGQPARPASGAGSDGALSFTIPNHARAHRPLMSFTGPDAERNAYVTGRFLMATLGNHRESMQWCEEHGVRAAATQTNDNNLGVLLPTQTSNSIILLMDKYGKFRPNAFPWPMTTETARVPRVTSLPTVVAVGENPSSDAATSDVGADEVTLTLRNFMSTIPYSISLAEEAAISIGDLFADLFARAFAKKEDECGFLGDGTSTYHGIVGVKNALAAGSVVTAAAGNTAFSTLDTDDFLNMVGKCRDWASPKWYIHRAAYTASMLRLMEAAGGNTVMDMQGNVRPQFLGYDVVFVEVMNSTLIAQASATGACFFGDLRTGAYFGAAKDMYIIPINELFIRKLQKGVAAVSRHDIVVHDRGTATEAGGIISLSFPGS